MAAMNIASSSSGELRDGGKPAASAPGSPWSAIATNSRINPESRRGRRIPLPLGGADGYPDAAAACERGADEAAGDGRSAGGTLGEGVG